MTRRVAIVAIFCGMAFSAVSCEMLKPAPQDLVMKGDHAGLETYYKKQATELREKAKSWDMIAESYEKHPDPHGKLGKLDTREHATHCRDVAAAYRKAASEADELARAHRAQMPHGMMQ